MRGMGNRDGAGVMYVQDGRVRIEKTAAITDGDVRELYERHTDKSIAFHLRHSTRGGITMENAHPYWVCCKDWGDSRDIALMHNGTITGVQVDNTMSDSYNFATYFLRGILKERPGLYMSDAFWHLVSGLIEGNKLILLDDRERFVIVNPGQGRIMNPPGVWISSKSVITPANATLAVVPATTPQLPTRVTETEWQQEDDGILHLHATRVEVAREDVASLSKQELTARVAAHPEQMAEFVLSLLSEQAAQETVHAI